MTTNLTIGATVRVDLSAASDSDYKDMRRFNRKVAKVVGIGDVLSTQITLEIGKRRVLLPPKYLVAA